MTSLLSSLLKVPRLSTWSSQPFFGILLYTLHPTLPLLSFSRWFYPVTDTLRPCPLPGSLLFESGFLSVDIFFWKTIQAPRSVTQCVSQPVTWCLPLAKRPDLRVLPCWALPHLPGGFCEAPGKTLPAPVFFLQFLAHNRHKKKWMGGGGWYGDSVLYLSNFSVNLKLSKRFIDIK